MAIHGPADAHIARFHGFEGSAITFGAYDRRAADIRRNHTQNFGVQFNNGTSHVVLNDLRAINANYDGFRLVTAVNNAVDIVLNRCVADRNTRHGFNTEGSPGAKMIDNVWLYDCTGDRNGQTSFMFYNIDYTAGTIGIHCLRCKSTYAGQAVASHGFSAYFAHNVHWVECESAFTNFDPGTGLPNAFTTEGIGFAFDDSAHDSSIIRCYSHDNQGYGIAVAHQANNNVCAYNLVVNNGRAPFKKGGIIVNGATGGSSNAVIYNNTVDGNYGDGISVSWLSGGAQIKNNISSNNQGYGIMFTVIGVAAYTVAMNLLYGNSFGATANVIGAAGTITS